MAGLQRRRDRDQEIGKLVVERLDPHTGLELHEQDRDRARDPHQCERGEHRRDERGGEQADEQAAADADVQEL